MRLRSMEEAAKMVQCAFILHNMCIMFGDDGSDLSAHPAEIQHMIRQDPPVQIRQVENRRQQILQTFV